MATGEREVVIAIQKSKFVEGVGKVQDAMKKEKLDGLLVCEKPCRDEFHAYWDGLPGDRPSIKAMEEVGDRLLKRALVQMARSHRLQWPLES
jgi:hypothetical protein